MPLVSLANNIVSAQAEQHHTLIEINVNLLIQASNVIRAVSHKLRNDILQLIHKEGYINVTEIYLKLGLEQTTVSQHLAILRENGFVLTQREGKCIFYTVNYERLQEVDALVTQLIRE